MAERTILVCDVCGAPETQSVTVKVGTQNFLKDLCTRHLNELLAGARRPRRGRRPGSKSSTAKSTTAKATNGRRRKRTTKAGTGRRGRPRGSRKAATSEASQAAS